MAKRHLQPAAMVPLAQGPYRGMRDSLDPSAAQPGLALLIQNAYPADRTGGGVWGRPGCKKIGSQLGTVGNRVGQRGFQFTKLDGTEYTVDFAGGKMYVYSWSAGTHTEVSLGALVLDASARIYCLTFTDRLIISDGVHKPIMGAVDGVGAWTFTELTNCPVLFGQPTIYYAKMFGIMASDRNTIVWSEENDPTIGYGTAPYVTSVWELGQTEQEALYGVLGTNNELVYFRARATGSIYGEVDDDFRSTGTLESYSDSIGTQSPDSIVRTGRMVYLMDADGHPQLLRLGSGYQGEDGGLDPIWYDCRETTRRIQRNAYAQTTGVHYPDANLVLLGFRNYNSIEPEDVLVFDAPTGQFLAVWRGFSFRTLDMVKDGDGRPTLRHIDANGYVHTHGHPQGVIWSDQLNTAPAKAIEHLIEGSPAGYDTSVEKHFVQIDYSLRLTTNLTGAASNYTTPERTSAELSFSRDGGWAVWDEDEWDTATWPLDSMERRAAVGISALGRWLIPRLRHNGLDEEFGLISITLWTHVIGPSHRVP